LDSVITQRFIEVRGVKLNVNEGGPKDSKKTSRFFAWIP